MKTLLILLGIGTLAAEAAYPQQDSAPITVSIDVQYGGFSQENRNAAFKNELLSYFRREIRGLGDVSVADSTVRFPRYILSVLGLPDHDDYDEFDQHVITIGVMEKCEIDTLLVKLVELGEAVESDSPIYSIVNRLAYEILRLANTPCYIESYRTIHNWGKNIDVLDAVRRSVANIDSEVFEAGRRQ